MVMPFIRLVAIYAAVIIAITAFFQRDRIAELLGFSGSSEQVEMARNSSASTAPVARPQSSQAPEMDAPSAADGGSPAEGGGSTPATDEPTGTEPVAPAAAAVETPSTGQLQPLQMPVADAVADVEVKAPALAQPPASADIRTRLDQARRAFWGGDIAKAQQYYLDLVADAPQNVDANGELGNLLYGQRRYGEAAEYYFAAGKLMLANGNSPQVLPLIQVLQGIAPDKAAELRALAAR